MLTLPLSEGLHLLFCVLYNVVSENHSVQNSPWGGGGSIASSRPIMFNPCSAEYINILLFVCFVALRPKSTAMVVAGRSVHLTTLFPGQA